MAEFILGFIAFLIVVFLMGIGVLIGKSSIKGSCGHASGVPGVDPACGGTCHNAPGNKRCTRKSSVQT